MRPCFHRLYSYWKSRPSKLCSSPLVEVSILPELALGKLPNSLANRPSSQTPYLTLSLEQDAAGISHLSLVFQIPFLGVGSVLPPLKSCNVMILKCVFQVNENSFRSFPGICKVIITSLNAFCLCKKCMPFQTCPVHISSDWGVEKVPKAIPGPNSQFLVQYRNLSFLRYTPV